MRLTRQLSALVSSALLIMVVLIKPGLAGHTPHVFDWVKSYYELMDSDKIEQLRTIVNNIDILTDSKVIEAFYKVISNPWQSHCKVGKWFALNRY